MSIVLDAQAELTRYEAPALELAEDDLTSNPWLVFVVFVGIWVTALWYAWYCRSHGGYPSISFGWSGFKVACSR